MRPYLHLLIKFMSWNSIPFQKAQQTRIYNCMTNVSVTPPSCYGSAVCSDQFNCSYLCPELTLKRHDTKPPLSVAVADDNGPMDLTGLVLEASMWCNAKLKAPIGVFDTEVKLADNIGFQQILPNDIIFMDRVRSPEQMLVVGFDEDNGIINVTRGFNSTAPVTWKRGQCMRIFRFMNNSGITEMVSDDVLQVEGCTKNELIQSNIIYEWQPNDTCVPGCFFLEFKLMKMGTTLVAQPGCGIGPGVEWVRRFPVEGEGFVVKIIDSPTAEL